MLSVTIENDEKKIVFDLTADGPTRSETDKTTGEVVAPQPVEIAVLMWEIGQEVGGFVPRKTG